MMDSFRLNERLANDCFNLGQLKLSQILLLNNALLPWFILVPHVEVTEFYQLESSQQLELLEEINQLSKFIEQQFDVDKLNVASIGNIVKQLHIHVVGRNEDDFCWPAVVWGQVQRLDYRQQQVTEIKTALEAFFKEKFLPITREPA